MSCTSAASRVAGVLVVLVLAGPLAAQEVQWRHDYNVARREAAELSRPLLLDFYTDNCLWCKRLDSSTFRDQGVVTTLNDRFIPLKVDAGKEVLLAQTLHIESFPTVVLAAPDGKILDTAVGYLDAPHLNERLAKVLASVSNPEWMDRDYHDATHAFVGGDVSRALSLLKNILRDGQNRPVQQKSRQLLAQLEQQGAARMAQARQLDERGHSIEVSELLAQLTRQFAGTQAAADASRLLASFMSRPELRAELRLRRARELLALARDEYRARQVLCCLEHCDILTSAYADLPEGLEAARLVAESNTDSDWLRPACDGLSDRLATLYLALADSYARKGDQAQAQLTLQRVQQAFPGTRHAEIAQQRLQLATSAAPTVNLKPPQ